MSERDIWFGCGVGWVSGVFFGVAAHAAANGDAWWSLGLGVASCVIASCANIGKRKEGEGHE